MEPKLTILFLLIGTIISLSHLGEEWHPCWQLVIRSWRRLRCKQTCIVTAPDPGEHTQTDTVSAAMNHDCRF